MPHQLWWDNEAGIGRRGGRLTVPVTAFIGTLSTTLIQLKPYDPESKGIVERVNGYLETSFLPGRTFTSPADFNTQLTDWLPIANGRTVRRIDGRPDELVAVDTAAMLALPPVPPSTDTVIELRLPPRDYYVRVGGNDYSVDPSAIGHLVQVTTGLHAVTVTGAGRPLADHERLWASGLTVTDPPGMSTPQPGSGTSSNRSPPTPPIAGTRCGTSPTTTKSSVSTSDPPQSSPPSDPPMGRWRDGRRGSDQTGRTLRTRAQGTPGSATPRPDWPPRPVRAAGATRNTSPRCFPARSRPANRPAPDPHPIGGGVPDT